MIRKKVVVAVLALVVSAWILVSTQFEAVREISSLKLQGAMPEIGFGLMSGHWLAAAWSGRNVLLDDVDVAIVNPFTSGHDVEAGAALFLSNCTGCHGTDGRGDGGGDCHLVDVAST